VQGLTEVLRNGLRLCHPEEPGIKKPAGEGDAWS
jgi:hypothetical protein